MSATILPGREGSHLRLALGVNAASGVLAAAVEVRLDWSCTSSSVCEEVFVRVEIL